MFQKMYLENIGEITDSHAKGEYAGGVSSKKLDVQFYWRALARNKWAIILFTAFATITAIAYSQTATPVYAANATLLLESQAANIVSIEDLVSSEQDSTDYYGTQLAILKSRALAVRVIQQLTLEEDISQSQFAQMLIPSQPGQIIDTLSNLAGGNDTSVDFDGASATRPIVTGSAEATGSGALQGTYSDAEFNEILSHFRRSLRISPVPKSKLVTITYESTDPSFAALAANAVANQYIQSAIERRQEIRDQASEWMDGRIMGLKAQLSESEEALLSFKQTNGLVDLSAGVGRLDEQELLQTSTELAVANNELSRAQDLYGKIQDFKSSTPQALETLPLVQNDTLFSAVKVELGQVQREILELKNRFGPRHPVIIDAESRLQSLRTAAESHIERTVASFENDYQLLQQRVAALESKVAQGKQNVQLIGQQKVTLEALEREVEANRDQYNSLFDRITETRTTDGLDEAHAVVAEAAWIPTQPVKPGKLFIIALATLSALILSAAVSLVREYLDDTVNSTEDVEKRLKTRLLGVLPLIEGYSEGSPLQHQRSLPLTPEKALTTSDLFSEAVSTCRTALTTSSKRNLQVILVTSSVPDEGKSTVALNLAYSFGHMERTLLIDCDLRRPSISKALGMNTDIIGLCDLMTKTSKVGDFVQRGVLNSFDCLTSGQVQGLPLEMLASIRFAAVMEILRSNYDRIIIDSPPTHVVSDALVLSKLSDGVVYVVKPHKTPVKLVYSGLSRLAEASASVVGVCISQLDMSKSKLYGDMEFHGFGFDYNGYNSYYKPSAPKMKLLSGLTSRTKINSRLPASSKKPCQSSNPDSIATHDGDVTNMPDTNIDTIKLASGM